MNILCTTNISDMPEVTQILTSIGNLSAWEGSLIEDFHNTCHETKPEILFVNPNNMTFRLDSRSIHKCVKIICTASTGTNHIDLDYCRVSGVKVISITKDIDVLSKISATAELAFCLTMNLVRKVIPAFDSVKSKQWDYTPYVGRQMDHLVAGVIGYGRLGTMYARYCKAFGMKVFISDPYKSSDEFDNVPFEDIGKVCDIISLHVHLNQETKHMVNANFINKCKKGFYLVNTSRGDVVDERAVISGLEIGRIGGYATDVLSNEMTDISQSPIIKNINNLNILVTPHIGGMTTESRTMAYSHAARMLKTFLENKS